MIKKIKTYFKKWIADMEEKNKPVGYLGRDLSKNN